jgi:hypothetical protein
MLTFFTVYLKKRGGERPKGKEMGRALGNKMGRALGKARERTLYRI